MKATSKLISVVLILAMCLSLFTVSAFAAGPSVIVIPQNNDLDGDAVINESGTLIGSGAALEEPATVSADNGVAAAAPAVPTVAAVSSADDLLAAAAKGGEIKLTDNIDMTMPLTLVAGTTLDLNGKVLRFANANVEQGTAISGSGVVKNGSVKVSGKSVPTQNGSVKTGFQSVASGVTFNSVNVSFDAPTEWAIFGTGVRLVYGSYNRDVSAWVGSQFELTESNDVFVIRDKTVAPEAPVATETEPVAVEGEQTVAEGEVAAEGQQAEVKGEAAVEGEQTVAEGEAAVEGEQTVAESEAAVEGEQTAAEGEVLPASDEEQNAENPADETPVNVVEEKEPEFVDEVRVSEDEEANEDNLVTLTGTDSVTGAEVIITGKNLPEGLTVVAEAVSNDSLGELQEGEKALLVLDIKLVDAEGNEYEPNEDPNVLVVSVQIKHPSLSNLEEGDSLKVYHMVDDEAQNVNSATQTAEDTMEFKAGSFSIYGVVVKAGDKGSLLSGGDGEVHKKVIKIENVSGDIYVKDSTTPGKIVFKVYGGAAPEAVAVIDSTKVSSLNKYLFEYAALAYKDEYTISPEPLTNQTADPFTVSILNAGVSRATAGKYAVVFKFTDTNDDSGNDVTSDVYMVQYVTIVPSAEIKQINLEKDQWGDYYFNKCSYNPMEFYLTAELEGLTISGSKGTVVTYNYNDNKKQIKVTDTHGNTKMYNLSEMLTVSDYLATDPVSHEFIGGKTLKLLPNLIRKLDFDDYEIHIWQKNHTTTPDNAKDAKFTVSLRPGITVADGLNDYIKGKNVWIKFESCWPIDYDDNGKLMIYIGGQQISKDYYSISNDHQTLWIYRNLLDQLRSNNSYTLTAQLWRLSPKDGTKETYYPASTSFNILAAGSTSYKSPKTGDNSNVALWAAVAVLSGGAVVALIPKKKKIKVSK